MSRMRCKRRSATKKLRRTETTKTAGDLNFVRKRDRADNINIDAFVLRNYRARDSLSEPTTHPRTTTINSVIYRGGEFSIAVSPLAREIMAQNPLLLLPAGTRARASPEEALAANKSSLMIRPLAQSQISHPRCKY